MLLGEAEASRERTCSIILSYLVEYFLAIALVFAQVIELSKEDAAWGYGIEVCFVVLVPDAVRVVFIVVVVSGMPARRIRERQAPTTSDTDSAFQLKQLRLLYIVLCIGIFLSTWHAVCLFSIHWGQTSYGKLLCACLLWVNLCQVVFHVAMIGCSSCTHRRPPLGHVAKPALQLAAFQLDEASHDSPCAICLCDLEVGEYVTQLHCKHLFHTQCIVPWVAKSNRCPLRCPESIEAALCSALVVKGAELHKLSGSTPNAMEPGSSRPVSPTAPSNQANPVSDTLGEDVAIV